MAPRGKRGTGGTTIRDADRCPDMVGETTQDGSTWYVCEDCGMMFETREEATQHEANCDAEEPSYLQ